MTPFLDQKPQFQTKNIPPRHLFLVSSYFTSHPITVLLKILGAGGGDRMGRPPPQMLGIVPPASPPKSPPMTQRRSQPSNGQRRTYKGDVKFGREVAQRGHHSMLNPKDPSLHSSMYLVYMSFACICTAGLHVRIECLFYMYV